MWGSAITPLSRGLASTGVVAGHDAGGEVGAEGKGGDPETNRYGE